MPENAFTHLIAAYPCRPPGSAANAALLDHLAAAFGRAGLDVDALPFDCAHWTPGPATLTAAGRSFALRPGPFTPACDVTARLRLFSAVEALAAAGNLAGEIVLLHDALAAEPLMPKEFPFYYPDEHRRIIDALEAAAPAAVIALTGRHPMSGEDPFSLFEDGNLRIANASSGDRDLLAACAAGGPATVRIVSAVEMRPSCQLVGRRRGDQTARIVVSAHMDTKYDTPGAADNMAGVATLLELAQRQGELRTPYTIELLPFNGEEHFAVPGQLQYLAALEAAGAGVALAINLDGLGQRGGWNAFSTYNLTDVQTAAFAPVIAAAGGVAGEPWYAGDHAMFAFGGTPCVAVTSSDLAAVLELTHTPRDAAEVVDPALLSAACDAVIGIINAWV